MKIQAPLSGILVNLSQVPDEVFSKRLVGDGISIDPLDSILLSPMDGIVEFIHPSQHALTIKASNGVEILIHIGLETVQLRGEGFRALVKAGERVKSGQALIEFDMDFVATQAKSLLTQILISNVQEFGVSSTAQFGEIVKAGATKIFEAKSGLVTTTASAINIVNTSTSSPDSVSVQNVNASVPTEAIRSEDLSCINPTGLHARPAAVLAQIAKEYPFEISLYKGESKANAKSVVSILSLTVGFHDKVHFVAQVEKFSQQAKLVQECLKRLCDLFQSGLGETAATPSTIANKSVALQVEGKISKEAPRTYSDSEFFGVMASPGKVLGKIFQQASHEIKVQDSFFATNPAEEQKKLSAALLRASDDVKTLLENMKGKFEEDKATIFEAHLELLNDPEVLNQAYVMIKSGKSAALAWQESVKSVEKILSSLDNEVMAGRAHDLHDIGQRVLAILLGMNRDSNQEIPFSEPAILVARSLTPSDMVMIDSKKIAGICTVEGGASSHVAILARSMGIAYVAAVPENTLAIKTGMEAVLFANQGQLKLNPSYDEKINLTKEIEKQKEQDKINFERTHELTFTEDGKRIEVFANIGKLQDAVDALKFGAEGVGLLRSEFLFLHRTMAPSEAEQKTKYQDIVNALKSQGLSRPVIIRTLDVGGDKPLPYLPMEREENPFLGIRGLRLSLKSQEVFRTQLRALLSVNPISSLKIMFPMVTTLSELLEAKKIIEEERQQFNFSSVSIGIMIEVPSAALMAETLAPHVDFFSIGSNDLTQYTLAIDRGHRELAAMADGLHPSVLKLIKMTCEAAHKFGKIVGVCGGIAGDIHAIPILLGLGVDELSVSVPAIPAVKAQVRGLRTSACRELADKAITLSEAKEVRDMVSRIMNRT